MADFGRYVNYVAYLSDCLVEIRDTLSEIFACEGIFSTPYTLKLYLTCDDFDCFMRR